jgi:hypothetical protein
MAHPTKLPAVLVAAALLSTGCGSADEAGRASAAKATEPIAGIEPVAQRPDTVEPTATGSTAPVAPPEDEVLLARKGVIREATVELELLAPRRHRSTVTVSTRLRHIDPWTEPFAVGPTFDDGIEQGGVRDTADGIYLIDMHNGRKHLVARHVSGRCLCDRALARTELSLGEETTISATFAAPPAAVDVFVPGFGTFPDVPLG